MEYSNFTWPGTTSLPNNNGSAPYAFGWWNWKEMTINTTYFGVWFWPTGFKFNQFSILPPGTAMDILLNNNLSIYVYGFYDMLIILTLLTVYITWGIFDKICT